MTQAELCRDLQALGVLPGATLIVHSSLSSLGWVTGGPPAVVRALIDALGDGTLVMTAATPIDADPDRADTEAEVFDPQTTPTSLGAIPEAFRNGPGTLRSLHPLESVCARGPLAAEITRDHPLAFSEGADGPFGHLHRLDAWILLLGVGFNRCTALHYAESLTEKRRTMTVRFPVVDDAGRRSWVEVPNVADDNDTHFPVIGMRYLATGRPLTGRIGQAEATLFRMADLVDFAVPCFDEILEAR